MSDASRPRYGHVVCAIALLLLLPACVQPPLAEAPPVVARCTTPIAGNRTGPALVGQSYGMAMTALPLNSVQFGSNVVAQSMAIQSLHAARTATNTVQVFARFVSCLDSASMVMVRTSFLRADTAPAEAPSAWKAVHMLPRGTAIYDESSVSLDAAHYLIEVQ